MESRIKQGNKSLVNVEDITRWFHDAKTKYEEIKATVLRMKSCACVRACVCVAHYGAFAGLREAGRSFPRFLCCSVRLTSSPIEMLTLVPFTYL